MKRPAAVQPPDCDMAIGCCDRGENACARLAFTPPTPLRAAAKVSGIFGAKQFEDVDPFRTGNSRIDFSDYLF
ncbi:hypothetical protein OK142_00560 [Agrobacterium sp. BT-220-3]|nr:hypothetical protein [Agrobacterium sp. BT-220-3]